MAKSKKRLSESLLKLMCLLCHTTWTQSSDDLLWPACRCWMPEARRAAKR